MKQLDYFIVDFDTTFVTLEALDELAQIVLADHPDREKIAGEVAAITKSGMEGKITFPQSLKKRLALFQPTNEHIAVLIKKLKKNTTPSIIRNKSFFKKNKELIYIISGGFKEYILPIVTEFGITDDHVLANTFLYDKNGAVIGYDTKNMLAKEEGKVKAVKQLGLTGKIIVIGDGITDYQIKERGVADLFYCFTENVERGGVMAKADAVIPTFDDLLFRLNLPRTTSYPKNRIKVLLLEKVDQIAVDLLRREGFVVETIQSALGEEELVKVIKDVSVLGIRSKTEITSSVLKSANKLLAIGAFCIGTNQINLTESAKRGIAVFNAPYSNTRSVVELALGEIIMLYRNVFDKSGKLHKGEWDKSASGSYEVRGKKLGIIGYGNIGTQLGVLAENLGMDVYFYDIVDKLSLGNAKKCNTMAELLKISDVITIHVDGRKTNKNLIAEREFSLMKKGVIFLNLARGHIVDIHALQHAIRTGIVAGCGVDVYPQEPKSNKDPFVSELQGLPNTILTPHIGGSTEEAQRNIGEFVALKLINFINSGTTTLSVNFPEMQLPPLKNAHRFMHIHENKPGMLAQINTILALHKINILGQYLKTNEELGYVISDVNKEYEQGVVKELTDIEGTIRFRILY